jgi:hypothetical protein
MDLAIRTLSDVTDTHFTIGEQPVLCHDAVTIH